MEADIALQALGALAAFAGGASLARGVAARPARARVPPGAALARLVRNGVAWADPIASRLLGRAALRQVAEDAAAMAAQRGLAATARSVASLAVAALAAGGLAAGALTASPVAGVAVPALAAAVAVARVHAWRDGREEALREAVPDALHAMGSCFQAGFSLLQTFQQLASEVKGPLARRFSACAHLLETGHDVGESLGALRDASQGSELAFVAVALDVQHQAGGSMRPVLEAARETVEGELALKRSLRVQTAQARLSARVVTVMPFALVAVFSVVSKGFLDPFLESPLGLGLLGLAVLMEAAGVLAVRRMLAVEVS